MKLLVVLAVAVACASADVSHLVGPNAQIVSSNFEMNPDGSYHTSYETSDGTVVKSRAAVKNANTEHASLEVEGIVKYVSPDGVPVELTYIANENGYQPQSNVLPTSPPVPEAILRSLDFIRTHYVPENAQVKRV